MTTMTMYDFTLHLTGPPTDEQIDLLFDAGCDDGTPGVSNGEAMIDFGREAQTLVSAITSAIADAESVPGIVVTRVSPEELVTAAEIAERWGRSRESVRMLIAGKRGPGNFPAPAARAGERSPLWRWADVQRWRGDDEPDATVIAMINAALTLRQIAGSAPKDLVRQVQQALGTAA